MINALMGQAQHSERLILEPNKKEPSTDTFSDLLVLSAIQFVQPVPSEYGTQADQCLLSMKEDLLPCENLAAAPHNDYLRMNHSIRRSMDQALSEASDMVLTEVIMTTDKQEANMQGSTIQNKLGNRFALRDFSQISNQKLQGNFQFLTNSDFIHDPEWMVDQSEKLTEVIINKPSDASDISRISDISGGKSAVLSVKDLSSDREILEANIRKSPNDYINHHAIPEQQKTSLTNLYLQPSKIKDGLWTTDRDLFNEFVQKASISLKEGCREMEVQLKPEYLGRLILRIAMEKGAASAHLTVETPQMKEYFIQHLEELRKTLEHQGYTFVHLDVDVGSQQRQQHKHGQFMFTGTDGADIDTLESGVVLPIKRYEENRITGYVKGIDCFA